MRWYSMPDSSSAGLGARLVEVEDQRRAREVQPVSVFERAQEEAGLLRRFVAHGPVAHGAVEVELEQGAELACLHEPVGPVDR